MNAKDIKPYKKNLDYSYTLGAFPTIELLKTRPQEVISLFVHPTFEVPEVMANIAKKHGIRIEENEKLISKLSDKENVFVVGIFKKYADELDRESSHLCLVEPSNMGNLGTIIRTTVAAGIHDIAIIGNGADIFNPKTVRASMGAVFRLRHKVYASYEDYISKISSRRAFAFMLTGKKQKTVLECDKPDVFTLIFGNEATGLPADYEEKAESIIIPQSDEVDSLNLTIAVGIGLFAFKNGLKILDEK